MLFRREGFLPAARAEAGRGLDEQLDDAETRRRRAAGGDRHDRDSLLDAAADHGSSSAASSPSTTSTSRSPIGSHRHPDRAQRRRQDDVLQRAHRALQADRRAASIFDGQRHHRRCRRTRSPRSGMARTFQNIRLFGPMTAAENVMVAMHPHLEGGRLPDHPRHARAAPRGARGPRHGPASCSSSSASAAPRRVRASNLSYGDQRRLEVARALALRPKLLLLDEPTAGMNPQESATFIAFVHRVRDEQGSDGPADRARHEASSWASSERITVLEYGAKIAEGTPATRSATNQRVIEAYLGKAGDRGSAHEHRRDDDQPAARAAGREPMLTVDDIHVYYGNIAAVKGISLDGAPGRDRHPDRLATAPASRPRCAPSPGCCSRARGAITFEGQQDQRHARATRSSARGICQSPEGRRIFPRMTVDENLDLGRVPAQRQGRRSPRTGTGCSTCSRASRSASPRRPARCPAASSRCSPSAGR